MRIGIIGAGAIGSVVGGLLTKAGRDVTLATDAIAAASVNGTNTVLGRAASVTADQLSVQAGRDIHLAAAAVNTTGDAALAAGRDLNLTAVNSRTTFAWVTTTPFGRPVEPDV